MNENRTYWVGLPVGVTVHDDGSVHAEVDFSEASRLSDANASEDDNLSDEQIDADIARVRAAADFRVTNATKTNASYSDTARTYWIGLPAGVTVTDTDPGATGVVLDVEVDWSEADDLDEADSGLPDSVVDADIATVRTAITADTISVTNGR